VKLSHIKLSQRTRWAIIAVVGCTGWSVLTLLLESHHLEGEFQAIATSATITARVQTVVETTLKQRLLTLSPVALAELNKTFQTSLQAGNLTQKAYPVEQHPGWFDRWSSQLRLNLQDRETNQPGITTNTSQHNSTDYLSQQQVQQAWTKLFATLKSLEALEQPIDIEAKNSQLAALEKQWKTLKTLLQKEQQLRQVTEQKKLSQQHRWTMLIALLSVSFSITAYLNFEILLQYLRQALIQEEERLTGLSAAVRQQERAVSEQATSVAEVTQMLEKLNGSSQESSKQASIAASRSKQIAELTNQGAELVGQTHLAIDEINHQADSISETIQQLQDRALEVGQIAALVENLAVQTNTLSLNAAIEAVRAGEQGRSFQVVAKEIRKLSQKSQQAAQRISAISDDIQAAMKNTVKVTQEGTEKAKEGTQIISQTTTTFTTIQNAVQEVNNTSHRMAFNAYEQLWPLQQLMEAMDALNQTAGLTAESATQLATGITELETNIDRIYNEIQPQTLIRQTQPDSQALNSQA